MTEKLDYFDEDRPEHLLSKIVDITGYKNRWHMWIFIGLFMVGMQGGGGMEWGAFALKHIRHRCSIPGLDELTLQHNVTNDTIYATFYNDSDKYGCWSRSTDYNNGCTALDADPKLLIEEAANKSVTVNELMMGNPNDSVVLSAATYRKCEEMDGFEWLPHTVQNSVFSQFAVVCDRSYFQKSAKSLHMFAAAIGAFFFGSMADICGRRKALMWQLLMEIGFNVGAFMSTNIFMAFYFSSFASMISMSKYAIAVVYGSEIVSPKFRALFAMSPGMGFGLGMAMYTGIGFFIRTWRLFTISCILLNMPLMLYILIMMPESPRWLLECGKYTDFKKVMRDLDRKAKTKIPKKIWKRMDKLIQSESAPPTCCQRIKYLFVRNPNISANHSSWDTIKMTWNNRMMRKWLWFFSVVSSGGLFLYYTMNSGDRVFNFSFYRYQLMMGLFEIPGVLLVIFLMDIIGRRATSITGMMFCALALILLQGFSDIPILMLLCASLTKMFVTGTVDMVFLHVAETLPTLSRSTGVGLCSCIARLVTLPFPYLATLNVQLPGVSVLVMVALSIVSAAACVNLPEPRGQQMPESVDDCQLLNKGRLRQRIFIEE
ncbi:solute carrier family 22 member 16-like isoform X2 [Symsagittifera roscoffensis]